jgi:hypothetical protein
MACIMLPVVYPTGGCGTAGPLNVGKPMVWAAAAGPGFASEPARSATNAIASVLRQMRMEDGIASPPKEEDMFDISYDIQLAER